MANELRTLKFKIEDVALKLQSINGLKHKYVVMFSLHNKQYIWMNVKEFYEDHLELPNGAMVPYVALSGYCYPPQEIIESMKAKEAGIDLNKKIITS